MGEYEARGSRAMASWSVTWSRSMPVFPAPVFPAPVFPAPVFPAPVFPAPVFPAPRFPAPVFAIRWPSTMYSINSPQLAKTNPSGCPVIRIAVIAATPAVVSASAPALRAVRAPAAASITVPGNSIAPTVDSGSRSTAWKTALTPKNDCGGSRPGRPLRGASTREVPNITECYRITGED